MSLSVILSLFILVLAAPASAKTPPKKNTVHGDHGLILSNAKSSLKLKLGLVGRLEHLDAVPVDKDGTIYEPDTNLNTQARIGFDYRHNFKEYIWLDMAYEHDLYTGIPWGGDGDTPLEVAPFEDGGETQLRKGSLGVRLGYVAFGGGFMMSHWGLGLIANDGAHGWTPNSAYFGDPRSGDRVLRGYLSIGPFTSQKLVLIAAFDKVVSDDILIDEDKATQIVGALILRPNEPRTFGVYSAARTIEHQDGRETEAIAIDVYGKWTQTLRPGLTLSTAAEFVALVGETELGPNPDFPKHDLSQMAFLSRTSLNSTRWGAILDFLFASGDQNYDDAETSAFQVDPNAEFGVLLFRHVMTAISARMPITAGDPNLVGQPAPDLERLLTRGSVSNTISLFPRVWWSPAQGLEIYGGPLFAFAAVAVADPLNTRLNGGVPRNSFDGDGGQYLGTELDLGIRQRVNLAKQMSALTIGIELAYFTPGSALDRAAGGPIDPIMGGRFIMSFDL